MTDYADLIAQARGGFPTPDEVANYPLEALVLIESLADALDAAVQELANRIDSEGCYQ
jgi:hypothetical protein